MNNIIVNRKPDVIQFKNLNKQKINSIISLDGYNSSSPSSSLLLNPNILRSNSNHIKNIPLYNHNNDSSLFQTPPQSTININNKKTLIDTNDGGGGYVLTTLNNNNKQIYICHQQSQLKYSQITNNSSSMNMLISNKKGLFSSFEFEYFPKNLLFFL